MSASSRKYRIVVGVDSSAGAHAALEWAAGEAAMRDAELVVVHAFDPAVTRHAPYAPAPEDFDTAHDVAVHEIDKIVTSVLGALNNPPTHRRYVIDLPARALTSACVDADLLVLGSDYKDGMPGIGATPRACLQTVMCPTTVVPSSTR